MSCTVCYKSNKLVLVLGRRLNRDSGLCAGVALGRAPRISTALCSWLKLLPLQLQGSRPGEGGSHAIAAPGKQLCLGTQCWLWGRGESLEPFPELLQHAVLGLRWSQDRGGTHCALPTWARNVGCTLLILPPPSSSRAPLPLPLSCLGQTPGPRPQTKPRDPMPP